MNIYRTLSLKKVLFSTIFIFIGAFFIHSQLDFSNASFSFPFIAAFLEICATGFLGIGGFAHAAYLLPQTQGYKYFRSLPDAFNKFRRYSVFTTILFSALGLLMFIPLIFENFKGFAFIILPTVYFIVLGLFHLISSFKIKSANFAVIQAMIGGGALGGALTVFDSIGKVAFNAFEKFMPVTVAAVFAAISIAVFYTRLRNKWNVC